MQGVGDRSGETSAVITQKIRVNATPHRRNPRNDNFNPKLPAARLVRPLVKLIKNYLQPLAKLRV